MFRHIPITDAAIWQDTLEHWKAEAQAIGDEGVFLSFDVEQRLNGLKLQSEREENLHCYFLVKNGNRFASSVLEVSHALPNSDKPWLKLLNITLCPSLQPPYKAVEALKEAFSVLVHSITHVVELIFHEHPSKELKIYGRTPEMVSLFEGVVSSGILDTPLDALQLSIRIESKWLVLSRA